MNTTLLILIIVAVVVIIAIVAAVFIFSGGSSGDEEENGEQERESRRAKARDEFGPEYERTAQERGSEDEAADELHERRQEVERDTEPLSDESRGRYEEKWEEVEQVFVDNPNRSIEMADRNVSDILEERNFVKEASQDDEETEKRLAVAYPEVAEDYREARKMRARVVDRSSRGRDAGPASGENGNSDGDDSNTSDEDNTEDLRQALRKYRAVFKKLTGS